MFGKNSLPAALPDLEPLRCGKVSHPLEHLWRGLGNENFTAGLEKRLQPFPRIADDRGTAGGRLEKTHAGRIAGRHHIHPSQIQGKSLRVVECPMLCRGEML